MKEVFSHPKPESGSLENITGAISLYCGSNDTPVLGQFVDVLKTRIIDGLASRGLGETTCEDESATLLDNL
jgi:hypothetical protein